MLVGFVFVNIKESNLVTRHNEMVTPESSPSSLKSFNPFEDITKRYSFLYIVSFVRLVFFVAVFWSYKNNSLDENEVK